ncbi:hypothetical protein [Nosocomiicoccus massiliensis]|uniref:hypothetical protein n=1 Tax=Nosocomiicoccus massiliensis TaxID=1232430 RepID=UPI00042615CD|nr:hypothetical protein [Nosocomiicoccus massiliensis]
MGCQNNAPQESEETKKAPTIELNDETDKKLFVLPNYSNGDVTFSGSEFKKGMTRSEILDAYGKPNAKFKTADKTYEIYGNVGLNYESDEIVDVVYYMNDKLDNAVTVLGEPDRTKESAGLHQYSYLLKENTEDEIHLVMWSKDGKPIGPVTIETVQKDDKTSEKDTKDNDKDKKDKKKSEPKNEDERVEQFMESYVDKLVDYFNGDSEAVLSDIEAGSNAEKKVKENKKSGNFKNQESYDVRLIKYTYANDDYNVTIERDYKHDKSNGKQTTTIDYKMKKVDDNTFKIVDYTEK